MERASFITSLTWVERGKSKPKVEKVKYTKDELAEVIKELKLKEAEYESRPESEKRPVKAQAASDSDRESEGGDFYDLDNYDEEPSEAMSNQPIETLILNNEPDSESEDSDAEPDEFTVKPGDNLILTGHVDDDVCMLEVFVFNNDKAELFLLHDIFLPSQPMSIEWLDYNTKDAENPYNLAAVGYMTPEIHIWDLSVSGCLEPLYRLGGPKAKKSQRHEESVLSLAWSRPNRNILASGSADKTVRVWDLQTCLPVLKLTPFESYVQSIQWHNIETQTLLTGCADKKVRLFDCRSKDLSKDWNMGGEIEQILWNPFNPFYYFASTDTGEVSYVDLRAGKKPVWNLKAHAEEAVMTISSGCETFFVTASHDESVKVWDLKDNYPPELVTQKMMNIGAIYTIRSCPDVPYVFCAGGTKKDNFMYLWDSRDCDGVLEHFGERNAAGEWRTRETGAVQSDAMDTVEDEPTAGSSRSLMPNNFGEIKAKKKSNKAVKAARREAREQASSSQPSTSGTQSVPKKKRDHKKMHPKSKRKDKSHDDE